MPSVIPVCDAGVGGIYGLRGNTPSVPEKRSEQKILEVAGMTQSAGREGCGMRVCGVVVAFLDVCGVAVQNVATC